MQVAPHPENRDGQGPSGIRCLELTGQILGTGFDAVEADANGVVVEQKPGCKNIGEANVRFAEGDDLLAPAMAGLISYGSLSHSTLNQLMRNINASCPIVSGASAAAEEESQPFPVPEDDTLMRIVDTTGRLSSGLLQQIDPAFYDATQTGLLWEVLAHTIQEEEPEACAIIQAALNAKNGLFLVCHEMQAISRLMTLTSTPTVVGTPNPWEVVLTRMRETMPQFCEDKCFIDMYSFVVDMGAQASVFLVDLKNFHQKFVNAKVRRLRLEAFATVNLLPLEMPHLKVAFLKHLYVDGRFDSHGFCTSLNTPTIKKLSTSPAGQSASALAEDVLRFFHVECRDAIAQLEAGVRVKFYGNLDKSIFAALIEGKESAFAAAEKSILSCGASFDKRLRRWVPNHKVPDFTLGKGAITPGEGAPQGASTPTMQPKVIQYDENGRPLTKQDERAGDGTAEVFGWSAFMDTSCIVEGIEEASLKTTILSHIYALHRQLPTITDAELKLTRGGTHGDGVHVVAAKALDVGAVRLAPLVQSGTCLSRLSQQASSPYVLQVRVLRDGNTSEWYLSGSGSLPTPAQPTASAVAEQPEMVHSQHNWVNGNFPWPLWFVKRAHGTQECNCQFKQVEVRCIGTFQMPTSAAAEEAFADNFDLSLPMLVNTKPLREGEELVVFWPSKPKVTKEKKVQVTWASQARSKLGKQRQK